MENVIQDCWVLDFVDPPVFQILENTTLWELDVSILW
jgi:hypothetical protein